MFKEMRIIKKKKKMEKLQMEKGLALEIKQKNGPVLESVLVRVVDGNSRFS